MVLSISFFIFIIFIRKVIKDSIFFFSEFFRCYVVCGRVAWGEEIL